MNLNKIVFEGDFMRRLSLILFLIAAVAMSASATWRFTDVTTPDMVWPVSTSQHPSPYASCVAWGDLNNDGAPDLFVGSTQGANCKFYANDGAGNFTDETEDWNFQALSNVKSAQFVDFDQDGLLDLFCITDNPIPIELYKQSENRRMRPVALDINAEDAANVQSAVWNDFNHDGQLDLIVNSLGERDPMMTAMVPSGPGFSPARDGEFPEGIRNISRMSLIDFDHDGDLDILAGSERNRSQFYVNNDGRYVESLNDYGLERNVAAQGVVWADFNNDSYLDFVTCGSNEETYMYMGRAVDGEIGFREVLHNLSTSLPYQPRDWLPSIENATSVHAGDYNMDGWTDLFFVRSNGRGNCLLINNRGEGWSIEKYASDAIGMEHENTRAAAWADIDGDGDLDLALAMNDRGIKLMRNELYNEREYFTLKIADYSTDTPELNCQVFVKFEEGSQWATTSMANSSVGFDNMSHLFVNPTNKHSRSLWVAVMWPSGAASYYDIDDVELWGTTTLRPPTVTTPPTGDPVEIDPELTADMAVHPNPFNPSTSVKYTVPEAGQVSLSVYNLLGQEVASLVSGYMEAGVHTVTFDASALPSGLYLARLTSSGQTQLHKMVLTK
jgi:hypothetical protein